MRALRWIVGAAVALGAEAALAQEDGTDLQHLMAPAGNQWHIVGGGCFTVPDEPARFVWTGR